MMDIAAEDRPIIVFGAARSGTTYLCQILNHHPDVYVSDETRIFVWAHEALKVMTNQERMVYREKDRFRRHLQETFPDLIREFYRKLKPQARYWGDKNPHYVHPQQAGCLETIRELFPKTRFIHIIRDGRDVVVSGFRGVWNNFVQVHEMWRNHTEIGCDFGRRLATHQYFEVRYEDLVRDDAAVAEKMFAFLGIDLHPAVVQFCQAQQQKRTPFSTPSRNLSRGISESDWSRVWDEEQQLQSLNLLGSALIKQGYETEQSLAEKIAALQAKQSNPPRG